MGANQQTSVPAFTAGQVLTAQQQTEINTGIPVFADSTARTAAFGGTGEKVLAEGQYSYLEDTNSTEVYDGSSWVAVGASGLVYVTGAAFSAVTSFSLPNGTFTSTYRNYRVLIQITDVTADADFTVKLRAGGVDTSAGYDNNFYGATNGGTVVNTIRGDNAAAWNFAQSDATLDYYAATFDVLGPEVATETSIIGGIQFVLKDVSGISFNSGGGSIRSATQFDSLSFISSVASSITGVYRVYAYADS